MFYKLARKTVKCKKFASVREHTSLLTSAIELL